MTGREMLTYMRAHQIQPAGRRKTGGPGCPPPKSKTRGHGATPVPKGLTTARDKTKNNIFNIKNFFKPLGSNEKNKLQENINGVKVKAKKGPEEGGSFRPYLSQDLAEVQCSSKQNSQGYEAKYGADEGQGSL